MTLDGSPFTWKHSALRNISYLPGSMLNMFRIIWYVPLLGILASALVTFLGLAEIVCVVATKRRMGDYIAKTIVVYADR